MSTTPLNELAALALRTESKVTDLNGQESQLRLALELAVIAGDILDQVKRKIFYGEKGEYKAEKLNAAAEKLAKLDAFDFTADEFTNRNSKTQLDNVNTRVVHGIVGNITEAAEMAEALIKYLDEGSFDVVNLLEEKADVDWYQAVLADELKFPLDATYQLLVAKLAARYGDEFSDVSAVIRDIGSERDVMERFLKARAELL